MAGYLCKDPDCTDTVAWHLINGDWDCLADNREAVADFARAAEANMPMPEVTLNLHVTCSGYEDQSVTVILTRLPSEEEQQDASAPPGEEVDLEVPAVIPPAGMPGHEHTM